MPETKVLKSPRHAKLLTDLQHEFALNCYMKLRMSPKDTAAALNKEFSTSFTAVQITEYARGSTRKWSAKRKKLDAGTVAPARGEVVVTPALDVVTQHQPFLEAAARIAVKGMRKAESMIDRAADARSLTSAVNAAKSSIEIYRKTVGLDDDTSPRGGRSVFNPGFARGPGSPFALNAPPILEAEIVPPAEPAVEPAADDDELEAEAEQANAAGVEIATHG